MNILSHFILIWRLRKGKNQRWDLSVSVARGVWTNMLKHSFTFQHNTKYTHTPCELTDSFTSRAHPQHQPETVTEKWKNHRWSFYWTFTCSNAFLLLLWKDWDRRWAQGLYSCRTRWTWPLWCMAFIKERLRLTPSRQKVEEFVYGGPRVPKVKHMIEWIEWTINQ